MQKVNEMVKILSENGYICKEIDRKQMAILVNQFPDSAFIAGDSQCTVYAVDTIDNQFRKIMLYHVEVCN